MISEMNDILNRESRTVISPPRVNRRSVTSSSVQRSEKSPEICENCDKSQHTNSTHIPRPKLKLISSKLSKHLLTLALSICIVLLLTSHSEAKPTHSHHHHHHSHHNHHISHNHNQRSLDTKTEINIFDLNCSSTMNDRKDKMQMTDDLLTDRLRAILLGCQDTLTQTKTLTDQYIRAMWNQNVETHQNTWKDDQLTWIHPNQVPLQKEFNKSINEEHLTELKKIEWKNHDKVFEYIGRIYQRLERVYVGIQIVNKWIELASMQESNQKNKLMNDTELEKSKGLFSKVTKDIHGVLCQIRELFLDVSINPNSDIDISPMHESQVNLDERVKLNHWIIYREYQNLMEYSRDLLGLILEKYGKA